MISKRILIPSIMAAIAVFAVASSPAVMAFPGGGHHHRHAMDMPELEFSEGSIPVGESPFENLDRVIPLESALASIDDNVLAIGLKPVQGHFVYGAKVANDDSVYFVIIDAGTGDELYRSEGKPIKEIEEHIAAKKAHWEEMKEKLSSGDFGGMKGNFGKLYQKDEDFAMSSYYLR